MHNPTIGGVGVDAELSAGPALLALPRLLLDCGSRRLDFPLCSSVVRSSFRPLLSASLGRSKIR